MSWTVKIAIRLSVSRQVPSDKVIEELAEDLTIKQFSKTAWSAYLQGEVQLPWPGKISPSLPSGALLLSRHPFLSNNPYIHTSPSQQHDQKPMSSSQSSFFPPHTIFSPFSPLDPAHKPFIFDDCATKNCSFLLSPHIKWSGINARHLCQNFR